MAWIPFHQSVRDHRKTVTLADLLDIDEPCAVGYVSFLWLWAIDNATDGNLPSSDRVIARAAQWKGDPATFRSSLVASGFLDETDDGVMIHSWGEYAGKLLAQRESNAEKQQRYRDRLAASRVQDDSVTVTLRSRVEKSTEEKKTTHPAEPKEKNTYPIEFEEFWRQYPSGNGAKNKTFDQWKRLNPDADLRREIMDGLGKWNASKRWADGYVKSAEIWVRDRMWENPPPALRKSIERGNGERVV